MSSARELSLPDELRDDEGHEDGDTEAGEGQRPQAVGRWVMYDGRDEGHAVTLSEQSGKRQRGEETESRAARVPNHARAILVHVA